MSNSPLLEFVRRETAIFFVLRGAFAKAMECGTLGGYASALEVCFERCFGGGPL
jgi:hypothetical protein